MISLKDILKIWPYIINKDFCKNVKEIYYFNFLDNMNENCTLEIKDGSCQFIEGSPKEFTNKISTETKYLLEILSNTLTIEEAIKKDYLKIEGADTKLSYFLKCFSGDPEGTQSKIEYFALTENEKRILDGKWSKPKKVLGLIGSPRRARGATNLVYSFFKQGLEESKCEIDTVYLSDLENNACKGCFTCWYGKDKKCVHSDDVNNLILKIPTYDLLVLAAPVYVDGLPGMLKNLIDRMICLLDAKFVIKDNHCRHPIRYPKMPHLVLLSTCGFTEMDNFSPMIEHVKEVCKNMHLTYIGEIIPPTAWMMAIPNIQVLYKPLFDAVKLAGKEIVKSGKISKETNNKITTQIFNRGQILAIHNRNQ